MNVINTTLVITDPYYLKDSYALMKRNTIYGDWSCMVYKGKREENSLPKQWDEKYFKFFSEYNSKPLIYSLYEREKRRIEFKEFKKKWLNEHCLGEFCADTGMVGVFNWNIMHPKDREWCKNHPWCAAIIENFSGDIDFEVEDKSVYVVGKGNFDFFSTQSGL